MQFFVDFGTLILTSYLAITGSLANQIENTFLPIEPTIEVTDIEPDKNPILLTKIDSKYKDRAAIPDILIRNSSFQNASAIAGTQKNEPSEFSPEDAAVNIFCTHTTPESIRTTTGSGFFVSRSGAVLTNAHVAQTLLLEDAQRTGTTTCVLRTGNPATTTYEAELLYIPPAWIQANASLIEDEDPMGTGERDFALLYASKHISSEPLPAVFPHIKLNTSSLAHEDIKAEVTALGYPALALKENGATSSLPLAMATSTLTELYTFSGETADLMSLSNSEVASGGSSGGPVLRNNEAIGMIVTEGLSEEDSLRALSISYIDRTLKEETGFSLAEYSSGDLAFKANTFATALAPFLLKLLEFQMTEE